MFVGVVSSIIGFILLLAGLIFGALTIWTSNQNNTNSGSTWEGVVGITVTGGILMAFGCMSILGGCLGCYFGWVQQFRLCYGDACCICIGDGCECMPESVMKSSCCVYLRKV